MEQLDWLDRKGVNNPSEFRLYKQDDTYVFLKHIEHGYVVKRRKDYKNWIF
jgi:hypothetical protein